MLKEFLLSILFPPGIFFCAWGLGWLFCKRLPKIATTLRWGAVTGLLVASLPIVSSWAVDTLQMEPPLMRTPEDAGAIVILGGDFLPYAPEYGFGRVGPLSLQRVRHGATWQRSTGLPVLVASGSIRFDGLTGAAAMAECLENDFGVPVKWQETQSGTTAENAKYSAEILREAGIESIILVTHAWHMPRARATFERQGLTVHAAPTAYMPPPKVRFGSFLPNARSFRNLYWAMHEWVGIGYYKALKL